MDAEFVLLRLTVHGTRDSFCHCEKNIFVQFAQVQADTDRFEHNLACVGQGQRVLRPRRTARASSLRSTGTKMWSW